MPGVEHKEGARLRPPEEELEDVKQTVCKVHINTLSSIWYGLTFTAFQVYLAVNLSKKLLDCLELSWENEDVPRLEIKACLALTAFAIILLPFFLVCSIIKVGNLANDSFKIGRTLSTCKLDPEDSIAKGPGGLMTLWRHGGPTAPFLHIVIAFSLLLPNLLIKARLIEADYLPREYVWKTDLDLLVASYDRLMVLSFVTSTAKESNLNISMSTPPLSSFTTLSTIPEAMKFTSQHEPSYPEEDKWGAVTVEFFNYAFALFVYAVRYPAVFWNTNKSWGILFSFQLFINGLQSLVMYIGVSVLYKVHLIGPSELLPALPTRFGASFFLLNSYATLVFFILSLSLVLLSSLVMYLYGYGRFNAFLSHEKACKMISVEGKERVYFTHCAALCILLGIAVVEGPILVDLAVIYKATLDTSVLICVVGAVFHLFIWVLLWLILTLKQNWRFKIRVTVGKAAVRSARSIKLLTDVELLTSSSASSSSDCSAPLLVVSSGRTYTVCDSSPKKTIINAIHKAALERKNKLQAEACLNKEAYDDNEEQIYWLRPKPISPKNSPDSEISDRVSWQKNAVSKPKVTFDTNVRCGRPDGDDGDYARLREIPVMSQQKMAVDFHASLPDPNEVQYVSTKKRLPAAGDYEDPNPLLTPEPPALPLPPPLASDTPFVLQTTPRCLLRADSGMPHDLTPRTESEASCSPPDHSETSSGVHSNSSRESHTTGSHQQSLNNNINNIDNAPKPHMNPQWQQSLQRPINPLAETNQVLIRHRVEPETIAVQTGIQDHFGRSTNMKMTSFTDSQSATLPHFPTQQVGVPYPHCSTMPLPPPPTIQPMPHLTCNYPRHSTIPTHHNGVRLFTPNPYVKRPIMQRYPHHSFPHLITPMKHNINNISERDSANFSMASSGDSDTYHS